MTAREILRWPDPRLKEVCAPVESVDADVQALARDMLETMYAAPGRGLAGPQIGAMVRLFVMDAQWKEGTPAPMVFINPKVKVIGDTQATHSEGCLSIPGISAEITRPAEVTLSWIGLDNVAHEQLFTGFSAACVQHEIDHLDGIVTFDHMTAQLRALNEAKYAEVL